MLLAGERIDKEGDGGTRTDADNGAVLDVLDRGFASLALFLTVAHGITIPENANDR
jgi:hypothetical protein